MANQHGKYLWITRRQLWPPATSDGQRNVYLRADWEGTSDLREEYSIGGLRLDHTREQVDAAYAALDMFREKFQFGRGGRPRSEQPTPEDVEPWIGDAIRHLRSNARA